MARLDRAGEAFQHALDEARRTEPNADDDDDRSPLATPGLRACVDFGPAGGGGGEARWDLAMDWTNEPVGPLAPSDPARETEPGPSRLDVTAAIAEELGLGADPTRHQLTSRWRAFLWRNHPDRQPKHARERANARVAIANALYDRARRELAKSH
jgi:hypothetical protein